MANSSITTPWLTHGFFGPVTATLDWCEANYQFSYYIAEMANTFSNLFTIGLAICGGLEAMRQSLPTRYIAGYAGIALVGIGSFAFHASLLFQAQLADELPMIYVGSMSLWFLFDDQPGFGVRSTRTKILIAMLIAFDVLFTWSYFCYRNPVYHQFVFATIVLTTAGRITYLLKWSEHASRVPDNTKSIIGRLFCSGAAIFALGFLIWNLDNIFCDTLTRWKVSIGWPRAFLLEGHSWWHVLTGAGTYFMFIGMQCT
ncbi:Alkaline ceramidase 3 [Hypsizygus marmoreus]|uniref:Alkaline ceramidase 3 n=1 Tax=Hypsizygus marmoreus TaxID=39966 RepID=A0A369K327_HYPMA|nr:Alkaline ceramidase 3 [Hypsizygus marmoreus]